MNDNSSMTKNDDALVAFGPPRPNAIVTYLPSSSEEDGGSGVNEYIPRVQALLYSIYQTTETTQSKTKKTKKPNGGGGNGDDYHYPPEVVAIVRKNNNNKKSSTSTGLVLPEVRQWYNSRLCTRIITVDGNDDHGDDDDGNNINNYNGNDGLLLHAFGLQQYDTIVSLQPTCLVTQDISHLFRKFSSPSPSSRNLELQKQKNLVDEQDSCTSCLLAAVPKQHHKHKAGEDGFDISVMVLNPQHSVKVDMLTRMKSSSSAGKVDMFLNSYFSDGFGKLPSHAKLDPCAYNATDQESWEANMTDDGDDDFMKPKTLYIVKIENEISSKKLQEEAMETTTSEDDNKKTSSSRHVQHLFRTCYEASIQHINGQEEKKKKAKQKELEHHRNQQQKKQNLQSSSSSSTPAVATPDPMQIHKLVTKRYKALRREGKSAHDAMKQAQHEYGQSTGDDDDSSKKHGPKPGQQVAAMFGLNMI
mmetsp:Transcript_21915/g.51675  ORF Transcript_21915/g.51675 Transcript_21915/m.51675 type:complete len:473 (+) Transcript_21915:178-1596(+)